MGKILLLLSLNCNNIYIIQQHYSVDFWYHLDFPLCRLSYLVGTRDFLLQFHLILPLPQHLLAEGGKAGSSVLQLERTPSMNKDRMEDNRPQTHTFHSVTPFFPSLAFLSSGTRSDWNFLLGQSLGRSLLAISASWKLATWAEARCTLPLAVRSGSASCWAFRASASSLFSGVWESKDGA